MAFKTDGLAKAYAGAQQESIRVKSFAMNHSTGLAAGNVSANQVQSIMTQMKSSIELWDAASGLSGMAQWAKDQEDDQLYDVVAEFTTMRAAAVTVRDWVINNFPTSAGGFIEKDTYELDGAITVRVFTPVETAALQSHLDALAVAIA